MFIKKTIRKMVPYQLRFLLNPLWKFLMYPSFRLRALYNKIRDRAPVDQHLVFYEAYNGRSMTGNPYAVFIYLLNHPAYKQFRHVWVIVDENSVPLYIRSHPRVTVVTYQSQDYAKYLATATYLINTTSFPFYFHKRREQMDADGWHGTLLIRMGIDSKLSACADHKDIPQNFLFTDYFSSPIQYTYEELLKSHDVYTLLNGAI